MGLGAAIRLGWRDDEPGGPLSGAGLLFVPRRRHRGALHRRQRHGCARLGRCRNLLLRLLRFLVAALTLGHDRLLQRCAGLHGRQQHCAGPGHGGHTLASATAPPAMPHRAGFVSLGMFMAVLSGLSGAISATLDDATATHARLGRRDAIVCLLVHTARRSAAAYGCTGVARETCGRVITNWLPRPVLALLVSQAT